MRSDLFEDGQSVLLIGEGNFSFATSLSKLKLNLKITASCFENDIIYSTTEENIKELKEKGVCVLLGVDATRLSKIDALRGQYFHRIVFNFPHIGGKAKIHLNRALLRDFFASCSPLMAPGGTVVVSLCRGQGGSSLEEVCRQPCDTWQVTEMAAHGGFLLSSVEPWMPTSPLAQYSCVGRRGRDADFRRDGALVHIFRQATSQIPTPDIADHFLSLLKPQSVPTANGPVTCSRVEGLFLKNYLLEEESSAPVFFLQSLRSFISARGYQFNERNVPLVCANKSSVISKACKFRKEHENGSSPLLLSRGVAFTETGCDFHTSPVTCFVVLTGEDSSLLCKEWLEDMNGNFTDSIFQFIAQLNTCVIYLDLIAMELLKVPWRELWARGAKVRLDKNGFPMWEAPCISPPMYTFDLTVAGSEPPKEDDICFVLWQFAGEIIESVNLVNSYASPEGWHSKCFRLTYRSYEIALFRARVTDFQNVIGSVLSAHLGLSIR